MEINSEEDSWFSTCTYLSGGITRSSWRDKPTPRHITQPPPQHLFSNLDTFLFDPNKTPRIYPFSSKQSLGHTRRPFLSLFNSPSGNPSSSYGALSVIKKVSVLDTNIKRESTGYFCNSVATHIQ